MSDMHDTRRLHGGGAEREPDESKQVKLASAVPASPSPQSAWDAEDRRKLWRQVTNLGGKIAYNNVRHIVFVTVICGALLVLVWRQQEKFEECIQAERDATVEELKKVHDALYRVDKNRETPAATPTELIRNAEWNEERIDERKGAYNSFWWYMPEPLELSEYDGDIIIGRFDELRVVHVLHPLRKGPFKGYKENTLIYLDDTAYVLARDMKRLDAHKIQEVWHTHGEPTLRELFRSASVARTVQPAEEQGVSTAKYAPHTLAELRQYDGEEIAWVIERCFDGSFIGCVRVCHLPYAYGKRDGVTLFLTAEDFAVMKNKKTFDASALEDARRNR